MPRPRLHVINETPREDHRTEVYVGLPVLNDTYIVKAKVDTGTQTNVLPYHIYALLRHPPPITKPLTILVSYNNQTIPSRDDDANRDLPQFIGLPSCREISLIPLHCEIRTDNHQDNLSHPLSLDHLLSLYPPPF